MVVITADVVYFGGLTCANAIECELASASVAGENPLPPTLPVRREWGAVR